MFDDQNEDQNRETDPITQQLFDCATGIARDDMYRISRRWIDYLSGRSWHTDTHRLIHALVHRTCRSLPEWSRDVVQPDDGYRIRSVLLRDALGLRSANCNRNLNNGVANLRPAGIFEHLGFLHGNEFLAWRYRPEVLGAILEDGIYGLFDASALPGLKRPVDFQVFCQVSLARRMRKPRFGFSVVEARNWTGQEEALWADLSRVIVGALQICCRHHGLTACVLLDRCGTLRGTDHVEVRLCRPGCYWTARDMAKLNPGTDRILAIDRSGHVSLRRDEFADFARRLRNAGWSLSTSK